MTRAQRGAIEYALEKARKGPHFGLSGYGREAEAHFEGRAQAWAETWVATALQAVLDNADGNLPASRMRDYF